MEPSADGITSVPDERLDIEATMRNSYAIALRVQRNFLAGHASALSVIETTTLNVNNIHEAIKFCLGESWFGSALPGLKYAEDLLRGEAAQQKDNSGISSPSASISIRSQPPSLDWDPTLWIETVAQQAMHEGTTQHSLLEVIRVARRNQVLLLLEFEKRRVSLDSSLYRSNSPATPPRPSRRFIMGASRVSPTATAASPQHAVEASTSTRPHSPEDEPAPMTVKRPMPPRVPSAAAVAGIESARARYLAQHGGHATSATTTAAAAPPPLTSSSNVPSRFQSASSTVSATSPRHPRSPLPHFKGSPHQANLALTGNFGRTASLGHGTPRSPGAAGSGSGHPMLLEEPNTPTGRNTTTPRGTALAVSPIARLKTPVDMAFARAAEADRAVLHAAYVSHDVHRSAASTPLVPSRPVSSTHEPAPHSSHRIGMGTPVGSSGQHAHLTPLPQVRSEAPSGASSPAMPHRKSSSHNTPQLGATRIVALEHPMFEHWMTQRRAFERGRYAEDYTAPSSPWQMRRDSDRPLGGTDVTLGGSRVSASSPSASIAGTQDWASPLPAQPLSATQQPNAGVILTTSVDMIEKIIDESAAREAEFRRQREQPPDPKTMMQHILTQPNARAVVAELLQNERGMSLYQSVEAWHSACVIQRMVRVALARDELRRRWYKKSVYVHDVLPKLDALEIIVRVLRGRVARRKYAAHRARVLHLIEERISLENDQNKEWVSTAAFSISRTRTRGRNKFGNAISSVFSIPFSDDAPDPQRLALRAVQRKIAARLIQAAWRTYQTKSWVEAHNDLHELLLVTVRKHTVQEAPSVAEVPIMVNEITMEIPQLMDSRVQSATQSRRGSQTLFLPLKGVKLSELEALQRERDEAERLRRLQLELIMQEKLMRQRETARKRAQAVMLIQRVCRAYRRRLFLFAKKLAQGGGRFLVSANVFMRSVTTHHMRKQVPLHAHTEIVRVISVRNPHLIPELRREMEANANARALVVQRALRAQNSMLVRAALQRFIAARRIQRWWRLWWWMTEAAACSVKSSFDY